MSRTSPSTRNSCPSLRRDPATACATRAAPLIVGSSSLDGSTNRLPRRRSLYQLRVADDELSVDEDKPHSYRRLVRQQVGGPIANRLRIECNEIGIGTDLEPAFVLHLRHASFQNLGGTQRAAANG